MTNTRNTTNTTWNTTNINDWIANYIQKLSEGRDQHIADANLADGDFGRALGHLEALSHTEAINEIVGFAGRVLRAWVLKASTTAEASHIVEDDLCDLLSRLSICGESFDVAVSVRVAKLLSHFYRALLIAIDRGEIEISYVAAVGKGNP